MNHFEEQIISQYSSSPLKQSFSSVEVFQLFEELAQNIIDVCVEAKGDQTISNQLHVHLTTADKINEM